MRSLKRIRYFTMNSWNLSTAPAYNLKVYNVIDNDLRVKVYEAMETENFYDDINFLIADFNTVHDYQWQAGFNGRSGGYLVLYHGGKHPNGQVFSQPGKHIDDADVPTEVLKAFRQLAIDIVKDTEYKAKNCKVETEIYTVEKSRKILV